MASYTRPPRPAATDYFNRAEQIQLLHSIKAKMEKSATSTPQEPMTKEGAGEGGVVQTPLALAVDFKAHELSLREKLERAKANREAKAKAEAATKAANSSQTSAQTTVDSPTKATSAEEGEVKFESPVEQTAMDAPLALGPPPPPPVSMNSVPAPPLMANVVVPPTHPTVTPLPYNPPGGPWTTPNPYLLALQPQQRQVPLQAQQQFTHPQNFNPYGTLNGPYYQSPYQQLPQYPTPTPGVPPPPAQPNQGPPTQMPLTQTPTSRLPMNQGLLNQAAEPPALVTTARNANV